MTILVNLSSTNTPALLIEQEDSVYVYVIGHAVDHVTLELDFAVRGVLVPFPAFQYRGDLSEFESLEHASKQWVDEWLVRQDVHGWVEGREGRVMEAHVPVTIAGAPGAEAFKGQSAILTWMNSD